jgi:hypothetical protein
MLGQVFTARVLIFIFVVDDAAQASIAGMSQSLAGLAFFWGGSLSSCSSESSSCHNFFQAFMVWVNQDPYALLIFSRNASGVLLKKQASVHSPTLWEWKQIQ